MAALAGKSSTSHDHAGVYDPAGSASTAVAVHEAASDPHPGYQREAEKGTANGYAGLDAGTKVPVAQLPVGSSSSTVCAGDDARLSDARAPTGGASGDLGGAYPSPTVSVARGLRETAGPTVLAMGAVADGEYLRRSGSGVVGGTPSGGGSDPWTKVILGADFTTSGTANAAVAGLTFTPAANKRYLVQAYLLLRTATATVGPRPGFSWPTGTTDGGAYMQVPNSATAFGFRSWGPRTTANAASTGVPDTTNSHLATGEAVVITGASPSGTFGVTLASETAGTVVTVKAGSFLLYREI